jgi:hypothetical protein
MLHLRRDQIRFHARQMSSIAHQEIKSYEISPAAVFKMWKTYRSILNATIAAGPRMRFEPPTIAIFDSPDRMAEHARWSATKLELQAISSQSTHSFSSHGILPVSTETLGPFKS